MRNLFLAISLISFHTFGVSKFSEEIFLKKFMSHFESEWSLSIWFFSQVVFELKKPHSGDSIKFFRRIFVKKDLFDFFLLVEKDRENYRKCFFFFKITGSKKILGEIQTTFRKSGGFQALSKFHEPKKKRKKLKIFLLKSIEFFQEGM